ncbi:Insulin-degrading enzyme [Heterostelium album PN500]|uniref:Insulin-degrading enzyme n=1 Tax=Heterostelium pallidum (strain ATCC 26659 / Pp 5 / PN500) TaxID=670386 RepID=D3BSL5_HETP5|nr:Insulin-degrading enzyme [Heterostelium album PN500]EFA75480.1 Insulin-degrading enzyme [Heterostelium album PN500]|eukprot:XP_020427614.1 Insulin-degrading enzyme [Heterostelium album PN500]
MIILQSPNDSRQHKYLKLDNELSVVLVSDPNVDQASACLSVGVGSLSNPDEYLGLAHFLEHMLFMGTEKYPVESEFINYVLSNGGSYNGSTSNSLTTYYFSVNQANFQQAIDRFSSFFVCPLFTESGTTREINAVNSEHNNNLQNDDRRSYFMHLLQYEGHPFGRFATGNLDTLKVEDGLREKMLEFYNKYYSSNIMYLAMVGRDPIETLESWARQYFSAIRNLSISRPAFPTLSLNNQPIKITMVPVKNTNKLSLYWPLSDSTYSHYNNYKTNNIGIISHIIGHESKGSLYSVLHRKGFVFSLSSSVSNYNESIEIVSIKMELTESGMNNIDEIVSLVYQYLDLITSDLPSYIHEEIKIKQKISWDNLSKVDPKSYSTAISNTLSKVPNNPEDVLKYGFYCEEYKPDHITGIMKQLKPESMVMMVSSKSFEGKTESVEKYYGINYTKELIGADKIAQWRSLPKNDDLHLIEPNRFMPKDFTIKSEQRVDDGSVDVPQMIYNANGVRFAYQVGVRESNLFNSTTSFSVTDKINELTNRLTLRCLGDIPKSKKVCLESGVEYKRRMLSPDPEQVVDFFQQHFVDTTTRKLFTTQLYPHSIPIPNEQSTESLKIIEKDDDYIEFKNRSLFYPNNLC